MLDQDRFESEYPSLAKHSAPLIVPEREIVGREFEIAQLMASMSRPELCNALLLGSAGSGKSAIVQAAAIHDTKRTYLELDLARMIAGLRSSDEMAALLKGLFDEAESYSRDEDAQLVLFIDEFHQVVQLSAAAVEALKPVLAASGARGIRVIAATTYEEFHTHVAPNQPLVERLQRINVSPPDEATTVRILAGMAQRYGVSEQFYDDHLFRLIHEYTERYVPASTQPRKSILVLDAMVGWHRHTGRTMDRALLADVLMESTGINVAFRVDALAIKAQLDSKVLSQEYATAAVANRLQLCVADLNDPERPQSSFLLVGSSGVGKFCVDSTRVPMCTDDGSMAWKDHGDLVSGDFVFARDGSPVKVLGVFPQGVRDVYRVTLWDGRTLDVGGPHLWSVYTSKRRINKHAGKPVDPIVMSTEQMLAEGVRRPQRGGKGLGQCKFFIPGNGGVQWPENDHQVDPYLVGAFLGNGCLTLGPLTFSSNDAETVLKVGSLLGSTPKQKSSDTNDYGWVFPSGEAWGRGDKLIQTKDLFASVSGMTGSYSGDRRIPAAYMTGSTQQRWRLVQGLFDTDGTIETTGDRFNVSYSTFSYGLAQDLRGVLFSLGVSNSLNTWTRTKPDGRVLVEYDIHVKVANEDKVRFFSLARKRVVAQASVLAGSDRQRVKKFDMVGISSIEKLPDQRSASCIYVDDDEHLYQAGQFIVTHNTELTKQLARLLFGDDRGHLVRFDMSEFAQDSSLDLFRSELTKQVWNMGHVVLLLDEVEKASALVTRLLLQVLDDGRLTDDNGRQVSFLNSYIVMTTNAGAEIFQTIGQYNADDTGSGEQFGTRMKEIKRSITTTQSENRFPPELMGRIDAVVPFQPLTYETQSKVVKGKLLAMVQEVLTKHNVRVRLSPRVLQYLIDDRADTDSDAGGARAAIATMGEVVTTKVAAFVNAHPQERLIQVSVRGQMRSESKERLASSAWVEVTAVR